jgi:hypothetical protein
LEPTKLFYPKWWLEATGFLESKDKPTTSSSSTTTTTPAGAPAAVECSTGLVMDPAAPSGSFMSHALVAVMSMLATAVFFTHFQQSNNKTNSNSNQEGGFDSSSMLGAGAVKKPPAGSQMSVELSPMQKVTTTQSYQQIL